MKFVTFQIKSLKLKFYCVEWQQQKVRKENNSICYNMNMRFILNNVLNFKTILKSLIELLFLIELDLLILIFERIQQYHIVQYYVYISIDN